MDTVSSLVSELRTMISESVESGNNIKSEVEDKVSQLNDISSEL